MLNLMRNVRLILSVLVGLCLSSTAAYATHLVGGELYYEEIGTNEYLITLKVYRDCGPDNTNNTQFDEQAAIGIYSNSGLVLVEEVSLGTAQVNSVPVTLENPCFILPPDLCIQEAIYTVEVELDASIFGYDLVYQRCCRNESIVNVTNAGDMGMTLWSHVPGTSLNAVDNSAPVFNNFPPVALCFDADFFFDHSATDADDP